MYCWYFPCGYMEDSLQGQEWRSLRHSHESRLIGTMVMHKDWNGEKLSMSGMACRNARSCHKSLVTKSGRAQQVRIPGCNTYIFENYVSDCQEVEILCSPHEFTGAKFPKEGDMHKRTGPIRLYLNSMRLAAFSYVSADRIRRVWVDWCA